MPSLNTSKNDNSINNNQFQKLKGNKINKIIKIPLKLNNKLIFQNNNGSLNAHFCQ